MDGSLALLTLLLSLLAMEVVDGVHEWLLGDGGYEQLFIGSFWAQQKLSWGKSHETFIYDFT